MSAKIITIISTVAPLLERIPENMPEFTLHDPNHSLKITDLMGKLLPKKTLDYLNSIEVTLLILSAYLHDVGMTCSKEEREDIIKNSNEFEILFKSNIDNYEKFLHFKNVGDHRGATFIEDQIFTEYLRIKHVQRSSEYIQENLSKGELLLSYNDIPFWKHLITICEGHGLPVSDISDLDRYPRHTLIGDRIINIQFLAFVLRLADILDLDPERTPKVIYEFVNPKDPVSILEWRKHRAVIGHSVQPSKVLFEAECSSPEVERALKQFIEWIERERIETMQELGKFNDEISKNYHLELHEPIVKDRIKSNGSYIYNDLRFSIDYQRVMELLMGQKLYRNPILALRELLQNSIDAIKVREKIYSKKHGESFTPLISIELQEDKLVVTDNGVGMDEVVFKEYFLQVGKSFYSSPIFYTKFSDVDVTSEFGIGVLSAFMIANSIIVESRKEPENPLNPNESIYFEIPTAFSYTIQRKSLKADVGTKITLNLKNDNPFKNYSLENIINELIPVSPYQILVEENGKKIQCKNAASYSVPGLDFSKIKSNESIRNYGIYEVYNKSRFYTHKLIDINFNNSSNIYLKDLKGMMSIVNTPVMNWYSRLHGYVAQRNFKVGSPEISEKDQNFFISPSKNIKNLFPNWTSYFVHMNLTKNSSLSLTPDRTDVITDEKFSNLKSVIEIELINELKKHFENIRSQESDSRYYEFIDFLFAAGYIGMDLNENESKFSKVAEDFFIDSLLFPVLTKDGSVKRTSLRHIRENETIGLVSTDFHWSDDFIPKATEIVKNENIELILIHKMNFGLNEHIIGRFISGLLGNSNKFMEPHTIITAGLPSFTIELIKVKNKFRTLKEYHSVHSITPSMTKPKDLLFILSQPFSIYPALNYSHPLFNPILACDDPNNEEVESIRSWFSNTIRNLFTNSTDELSYKDKEFFQKLRVQYPNYYEALAGIFLKDPNLMNNLRKVCSDYWERMKSANIIKDQIMPKITIDDFPGYWSK